MSAMTSFILPLVAIVAGADPAEDSVGTIPILYSTDLHHPHQDPDDHFDLATLFSIREFDIRGVILDCGARQLQAPGAIPLRQMMHLTGREVPQAIGLGSPLRSPGDDARDQPAQFQNGVALMLEVLRESPRPVTVFTTGSLRDVAAGFNRAPGLFREKVGRLYVNIGDSGAAGGGQEYNVKLDPNAYVCILRSGLPIYWCPCFDGGVWQRRRGYATYWQFSHEEVLPSAPAVLQNWFIYALTKPAGADPIGFLSMPQEPSARRRVWGMRRNMWCTAPLLHAAGREVTEASPGRHVARPAGDAARDNKTPYDFVPARVTVDDDAKATLLLGDTETGREVRVFKILDQAGYDKIMTGCLGELFAELPVAQR